MNITEKKGQILGIQGNGKEEINREIENGKWGGGANIRLEINFNCALAVL